MYSKTVIIRGQMGMSEKLESSQASNYTHYFCLNTKWRAFEYPLNKPQDSNCSNYRRFTVPTFWKEILYTLSLSISL